MPVARSKRIARLEETQLERYRERTEPAESLSLPDVAESLAPLLEPRSTFAIYALHSAKPSAHSRAEAQLPRGIGPPWF